MFCIASLEPSARVKFCFKCTPEKFAELVEIQGVIPAPYMARNHWVGIVEVNALRQPEMKELIQSSYQMVFEKLPKKLQAQLNKKKSSAERVVRKRTR
jgi:predicted DNA-binding protein (MmcQ/YjbR family)